MEAEVDNPPPPPPPAVAAPGNGIDQLLPLPYRVATLLVLGTYLYALALQHLSAHNIDTPSLLRYPTTHPQRSHQSAYRLAFTLSLPLVLSILLFYALPSPVLPLLYLLFLVAAFVLPTSYLSRRGRGRFLSTLRRVGVGGIAHEQDGRFADVLVADVLTSYAKPIADLYVVVCLQLRGRGLKGRPDRSCGGSFMVPFLIGVPFLYVVTLITSKEREKMIRFRQCLTECLRARSQGKTGFQHLANALKYATAFPVLIISALKRESDPSRMWASETGLSRVWLLAIFTNSLYSFYWDVAKDWDLTLFSPAEERNDPEHPWGLRKTRIFKPDVLYYAAMVVDLLLRCTWSLKLSVHLYHLNDLEGGIFLLELFEILRRWMWIYLRVETEWIRQRGAVSLDSVPLVDVQAHAKIDDD